jgi:ADP-ribose pyrophosphatase
LRLVGLGADGTTHPRAE